MVSTFPLSRDDYCLGSTLAKIVSTNSPSQDMAPIGLTRQFRREGNWETIERRKLSGSKFDSRHPINERPRAQ